MVASAGAVHALENAMLCSRPSVSLTEVLCSPVKVDGGYTALFAFCLDFGYICSTFF